MLRLTLAATSRPKKPDEPILVRMERTPCLPGLAGTRSAPRGTRRFTIYAVRKTFERSIRDQFRACSWRRRIRSSERYHGHHGESLAAWIRVRIQLSFRSGMAEGREPVRKSAAKRFGPNRDCKFRRRELLPTPIRPWIRPGAQWKNCIRFDRLIHRAEN